MERLRFRSTSVTDLQAELRQRELVDEAERRRTTSAKRPDRRLLLLPKGLRIGLPSLPRRRPAH